MTIGAIVGSIGGAVRGASTALAGSQIETILGAPIHPPGISIDSVSSAIFSGLTSGLGGCALGAQLGEKLDRYVLANNLCLLCGYRFNLPS